MEPLPRQLVGREAHAVSPVRRQDGLRATVVCLTTATLLGACSSPSAPAITDWTQANVEYRTFVARFPYSLPNGVEFPAELERGDPATRYEKGWGKAMAFAFWRCAHEDVIVSAANPDAVVADSFAQFDRALADGEYMSRFPDDEGVFRNRILGPARLGDTSILSELYASDCAWYRSAEGR